MSNTQFFSGDYAEARQKFLSATKPYCAAVESLQLPQQGPAGEDLFTDVVTLGDNAASKHLLLSSATHGVEGFCGSAAQTQALTEGWFESLPKDLAVTFIHAINPFGFAWLRRVNEDNIDLNRNFIDFNSPAPSNPDYQTLLTAIIPKSLNQQDLETANRLLADYGKRNGFDALQATLTQGQYQHANGVYYGGKQASWSHKMFKQVVSQRLGFAQKAIMIDYHTGLGPYGHGELISEYSPQSNDFHIAQRAFADVTSTIGGDSSSAKLEGTIDFAFHQCLPNAQVTALALEFGTREGNEVFASVRSDNWLHLQKAVEPKLKQQVKAQIKDAFYPEQDDWKKAVLARSEQVIGQAVEALSRPD